MRIHLTVSSDALVDNPLRDPHRRDLYLVGPDGMPEGPAPVVWYLAGYGGVGGTLLSHDPWQEGLEARLTRLYAKGAIGPLWVALPDAFTRLGGCQYLSSPAVGDYARYLLDECRAVVTARVPVTRHAIAGKSSGGFGALVHAMRRPDLFDAVVCHSGDLGFEMSVFPDIPRLMDAIRDHGSVEALLEAHHEAPNKREGRWFAPLMVLALAAVYSPDPSGPLGIGLPFDLERGTLLPEVLDRWRAWDPVRWVERSEYQEALRGMRLVFVDCGRRDEHFLHWGARAFSRKLEDAGVDHVFELFDGGHRGTGFRLDVSLPRLSAALTGC